MLKVYCDFDGTITTRDTIVFLTEQFGAGPEYRREVLDLIVQGEITVFEAIRRELGTVKVSWEDAVIRLREQISLDPGFGTFVQWCKDAGSPLTIVSSGMEPVVRLFLEPFDLPIYAHSVIPSADGWQYTERPENDKRMLLAGESSRNVVYIGDGTSDVEVIPYVNHLFAKSGRFLESHCKTNGIPHRTFTDFNDVREAVRHLEGAPLLEQS
jgi:HAD superfamily phosphoserine phosphatase-like hydrolase